MRGFIPGAAAVTLGLLLAATAGAGPKGGGHRGPGGSHRPAHPMTHGGGGSHHPGTHHPGAQRPGPSHAGLRNGHAAHRPPFVGQRYAGRGHRHWTHGYWWGRYGCYTYYCPDTGCWYYWYAPDDCYYPCSYIEHATPAPQAAPAGATAGVTLIVNVTVNAAAGPAAPAPPGP